MLLGFVLNFDHFEKTHVPAFDDISLSETKIIFSDYFVLALMDVLPLQLTVFVHNVVKGVDVHVRAETKQKVAHHFVDPDRPLHRGKTVSVDGVPDVKMKEIKFLLRFVERRFDESGVGKGKVSGKSSVVGDE